MSWNPAAWQLEKGGLERPGEVWVLQGVALAELRRFDEAIDAFESAKRVAAIRRYPPKFAKAWIGYVKDRTGDSSADLTSSSVTPCRPPVLLLIAARPPSPLLHTIGKSRCLP